MSLTSAVFVVFLVLKLTHVIAWSWWIVTAPLWLGLAIASVLFVVAATITAWRDRA